MFGTGFKSAWHLSYEASNQQLYCNLLPWVCQKGPSLVHRHQAMMLVWLWYSCYSLPPSKREANPYILWRTCKASPARGGCLTHTPRAAPPHYYCTWLHIRLINRTVLRIYGRYSSSKTHFFQTVKNGTALEYVKVKTIISCPPEKGIYLPG